MESRADDLMVKDMINKKQKIMELTDEDSMDFSPIELLPTEILQKILISLPVHDRVRVERVCKRWKNVSSAGVWKDVQGLIIARRFRDDSDQFCHPFNDSNKFTEFTTMEDNRLYIAVNELAVIQSLVTRAGQHVKEFICDSHIYNSNAVLSLIATHCHNIESIQLDAVYELDIEVFLKVVNSNKQLNSFACGCINNIEELPLRNWKSLYIKRIMFGRKNTLFIPNTEKMVALIENSPSLQKFCSLKCTPHIFTALSKCKQLKNLFFSIEYGVEINDLMMDASWLNRLTCLKVKCREDDDDLIINVLRHCINLESLSLYYDSFNYRLYMIPKCAIPIVVQEAVLSLPKLESLEIDAPDLTDKFLSRLLKFKHLRLKGIDFCPITENGIFKMITRSECLEKLEIFNISLTEKFFKKLVRNTRERRKILQIKVDPEVHEKALKICKGSRIHLIKELDDLVRNIEDCL